MEILTIQQGSEKWHRERLGKITASCFGKLITSQGKPSTSRETYLNGLVAQIVSGKAPENYQSEAMKRGSEMEPEARTALELIRDYEVTEVGIIRKDEWVQCSPDGLIYQNEKIEGAIEIKCPLPNNQVKYLKANKVPAEYIPQTQGYFYCCEDLKWLDFFSYCPGLPPLLIRTYPDRKFLDKLDVEIQRSIEYLKKTVEQINQL